MRRPAKRSNLEYSRQDIVIGPAISWRWAAERTERGCGREKTIRAAGDGRGRRGAVGAKHANDDPQHVDAARCFFN
jgi:hypothetical protein